MSTITQEWLRSQISAIKAVGITDSNTLQAFEIALASLEAEPVGYFGRFDADDEDLIDQCSPNIIGAFPLYAAPPAPANAEPVAWLWSNRKHPSEVTLVRPEDDEKAEGAHWSGWSCQALYAEPPAPVSVADEGLLHMAASAIDDLLSNKDRSGAGVWVDIPAKLRRAVMLQGADGNSPVIPDGLRLALSNAGIAAPESDEMLAATCEKCIQALVTWVKERKPFRSAVIPDGWVMMPVEPTEEMLDEFDSIIDYGAEDSKDAWSRLIAAAPQQEVKP